MENETFLRRFIFFLYFQNYFSFFFEVISLPRFLTFLHFLRVCEKCERNLITNNFSLKYFFFLLMPTGYKNIKSLLHFKCDKTCTFKSASEREKQSEKRRIKKIIYGGQWVSKHMILPKRESVYFQWPNTQIHYELYTRLSGGNRAYSLYTRKNLTDRSSLLLLLSLASSRKKPLENFISKRIPKKNIEIEKCFQDLIKIS